MYDAAYKQRFSHRRVTGDLFLRIWESASVVQYSLGPCDLTRERSSLRIAKHQPLAYPGQALRVRDDKESTEPGSDSVIEPCDVIMIGLRPGLSTDLHPKTGDNRCPERLTLVMPLV